jgi:hypothetical protein
VETTVAKKLSTVVLAVNTERRKILNIQVLNLHFMAFLCHHPAAFGRGCFYPAIAVATWLAGYGGHSAQIAAVDVAYAHRKASPTDNLHS